MRWLRGLWRDNRWVCYLSLLALGIILIVWLMVNRRNLQECLASYKARNEGMAKVRALKARVESLSEEKRLLESGTEENEIAARNRFRMVREGEHVVLVERDETSGKKEEKTD